MRFISYIHCIVGHRQECHVGDQVDDCKLGLCQGASFAMDVQDFNSTNFRAKFVDVQEASSLSSARGGSSHFHQLIEQPHAVDYVPPNLEVSKKRAQLFVLEDTEPDIQFSFCGRKHHKGRVSRAQRVDLDWLFVIISLNFIATLLPNALCRLIWVIGNNKVGSD